MLNLLWILVPVLALGIYRILDSFYLKKRKQKVNSKMVVKWPIYYAITFGVTFVGILTLGLYLLFGEKLKGPGIGLSVVSILFLLGFFYLSLYKISIYDDCVVFRSMLRKKTFKYTETIIVTGEHSTLLYSLKGKELARVASYLDYNDTIEKAYRDYFKKNKLKRPQCSFNQVKPNRYVLCFGIGFMLLSLIFFTLFVLMCTYLSKEVSEDRYGLVWRILCLVFFILGFLLGSVSLLSYFNWRLTVEDNRLLKRGQFRHKTSYSLDELTLEWGDKLHKIRNRDGKTISLVFIYLCDSVDIIEEKIQMKEEQ